MSQKTEAKRAGPSHAAVFFGVVLAVAACLVLYRIRAVFLPFIIGLVAAYLLDPVLDYMQGKGMSRAAAIWVTVGGFAVLLLIIAILVVPLLVVEVQQFARHLPDYMAKLEGLYFRGKERLRVALEARSGGVREEPPKPAARDPMKAAENQERLREGAASANLRAPEGSGVGIKHANSMRAGVEGNKLTVREGEGANERGREGPGAELIAGEATTPTALPPDAFMGERVDSLVEQLSQKATELLHTALSRIGAWLWGSLTSILILIIVPFIAFYFLRDIDAFKRAVFRLLPEDRRTTVQTIGRQVNRMLSAYLRGLTIVCFLLAVTATAMLYVLSAFFGIQYCLLVGILTGITYAVPYLGPTTAAVVAGAVGYATADHHAVLAGVLALGLQIVINQLFDSLVMPRVVGEKVGLHPLIVIFALMAGFQLWGIFGMIVAVPLAASIKISVHQLYPALAPPDERPPSESEPDSPDPPPDADHTGRPPDDEDEKGQEQEDD